MPPKKKEEVKTILLGRPRGTLKMGLVGLPNVGKSSTFNLLSQQSVPAENYPFCTIDPSEARVNVTDERFTKLCSMYKPKSEVSATLSIVDIAGLVPGAHKGEGLGNAFLSHIQNVDGIYHVVRAFDNEEVTHTDGSVDPVRDLETISNELRLKDLERCQKKYDELSRLCSRGQDKTKKADFEMTAVFLDWLKSGKWISAKPDWSAKEVEVLNEFAFLTAKSVVYLINMSERDYLRQKNKYLPKIHEWIKANVPGPMIPYSADYEAEIFKGGLEEEAVTNGEPQTHKSAMDKITHIGYTTLHLIHYFTAGEDECKCWTVREGTKAPQAAGIIHSDMELGFICADVTKYADLIEYGSESSAKAAGKVQTKGKDYVVEDGDIMYFKFNPSGGKK